MSASKKTKSNTNELRLSLIILNLYRKNYENKQENDTSNITSIPKVIQDLIAIYFVIKDYWFNNSKKITIDQDTRTIISRKWKGTNEKRGYVRSRRRTARMSARAHPQFDNSTYSFHIMESKSKSIVQWKLQVLNVFAGGPKYAIGIAQIKTNTNNIEDNITDSAIGEGPGFKYTISGLNNNYNFKFYTYIMNGYYGDQLQCNNIQWNQQHGDKGLVPSPPINESEPRKGYILRQNDIIGITVDFKNITSNNTATITYSHEREGIIDWEAQAFDNVCIGENIKYRLCICLAKPGGSVRTNQSSIQMINFKQTF